MFHLALEVLPETLLPRAESFLEFLNMTSVSFGPQPDPMRRPTMERIHAGPQPDLMRCLTKNSMQFQLLCSDLARIFRINSSSPRASFGTGISHFSQRA